MVDSSGGDDRPGSPLQAALTSAQMRLDAAWRTYITHTQSCPTCIGGIDCELAAGLKQT